MKNVKKYASVLGVLEDNVTFKLLNMQKKENRRIYSQF